MIVCDKHIEEFVRQNLHIDYMLDDYTSDKKQLTGILQDSEWVIMKLTEIFVELYEGWIKTGELDMGIWVLQGGDKNNPQNYPVELEINDDDEVWNGFVYFDTGLGFDDMETGWTLQIDPEDMKSFIRDKKLDLLFD